MVGTASPEAPISAVHTAQSITHHHHYHLTTTPITGGLSPPDPPDFADTSNSPSAPCRLSDGLYRSTTILDTTEVYIHHQDPRASRHISVPYKMDSMRSLNTSLPKSSSKRPKPSYPQAGLQQAFKAAAFSVTQLYKAAAAEEDTAHAAGYQAAIDELLGFLDAENLGLGDGEGWRVRQWATERLTPNIYGSESDEEDEGAADSKHPTATTENTGVSPTDQSNTNIEKGYAIQQPASSEPTTSPSTRNAPITAQDDRPRHSSMFRFTANPQSTDIDMSASSPTNTMAPPTSLRLNVRPSRQPKRRRSREPSQPRAQALGLGAGLKRKGSTNFDFTDFAGFEKDWHGPGGGSGGGSGSSKRGRWE